MTMSSGDKEPKEPKDFDPEDENDVKERQQQQAAMQEKAQARDKALRDAIDSGAIKIDTGKVSPEFQKAADALKAKADAYKQKKQELLKDAGTVGQNMGKGGAPAVAPPDVPTAAPVAAMPGPVAPNMPAAPMGQIAPAAIPGAPPPGAPGAPPAPAAPVAPAATAPRAPLPPVITVSGPQGKPVAVATNQLSPAFLQKLQDKIAQMPQGGVISAANPLPMAATADVTTNTHAQPAAAAPPAAAAEGGEDTATSEADLPAQQQFPETPGAPKGVGGGGGAIGVGELEQLRGKNAQDEQRGTGLVDQATAIQIQAQTDKTELEKQQLKDNAAIQNQALSDQMALQARHLKLANDTKTLQESALSVVQGIAKQQASRAFDPNHFLNSRGFGGQMLAAISVGLGAIGAAYTHGPNAGLEIIQEGIRQDVAAQKEQYEQGQNSLGEAKTVYAQLRQRGLDENQAYAGSIASLQEQAKARIAALGATYAGPLAEANKKALLGGLWADQAKQFQTIASGANERALSIQKEIDSQQDAARGRVAGASQKHDDLEVPGVGYARNPKAAEEANELTSNHRTFMANMRDLQELVRKHSGQSRIGLKGEAANEAFILASQLKAGLMDTYGIKKFTEYEQGFLDHILKDPTSADWFGRLPAAYRAISKVANRSYQDKMNQKMQRGWRNPAPHFDAQPIEGGK